MVNLFVFLVLAYPPSLIIANVVGFKVNLILAAIIVVLVLFDFSSKKKNVHIVILIGTVVFAKYMFLGSFGMKALLVIITGPLIFSYFVVVFNNLSYAKRNIIFNVLLVFFTAVSIVVVLQSLALIPLAIGNMEFINKTGLDVFGELSDEGRPSAYFYHPYDTALSLIPILTFYVIRYVNNKVLFIVSCTLVALITFLLGLKILLLYIIILILSFSIKAEWQTNQKTIYFLFLSLIVAIYIISKEGYLIEYVQLGAGRFYMWHLMMSHFIEYADMLHILLGYNEDILSISAYWSLEESYTSHNQYLYTILHLGILFLGVFLYLLKYVLITNENLNFIILIMFSTFALSGDLFVFLTFWICLCQLYVVFWKLNKTKDNIKIRVLF